MTDDVSIGGKIKVALRKESVDRNAMSLPMYRQKFGVALRKESVDRNHIRYTAAARPSVALRKESVDRNKHTEPTEQAQRLSLSARRAWIEMSRRVVLLSR